MSALGHLVAPIFIPADRPERFAKAAASGADGIILDLEDAVAPENKYQARQSLCADFTDLPVVVRINAPGTAWYDDDMAVVARLPVAAIMVPKAEKPASLAVIAAAKPVLALIETARGLAAARDIAACGHAGRLAFGSVDYAADLGCAHTREALSAARLEVVLASRLGGLPAPIDGVTLGLGDMTVAGEDAAYARGLGFGGKLLIHPAQAGPVSAAFSLTAEEQEWALQVLSTKSGGVVTINGEMVDEPVRRRARAILARAAPPAPSE